MKMPNKDNAKHKSMYESKRGKQSDHRKQYSLSNCQYIQMLKIQNISLNSIQIPIICQAYAFLVFASNTLIYLFTIFFQVFRKQVMTKPWEKMIGTRSCDNYFALVTSYLKKVPKFKQLYTGKKLEFIIESKYIFRIFKDCSTSNLN